MLPAVKEVAAVSATRPQKRYNLPTCHNWLSYGRCDRKDCSFAHTPEHKGRSDLLPLCEDKGKCTRPNCRFKHLPDATLEQAPAQELAAVAKNTN